MGEIQALKFPLVVWLKWMFDYNWLRVETILKHAVEAELFYLASPIKS